MWKAAVDERGLIYADESQLNMLEDIRRVDAVSDGNVKGMNIFLSCILKT